MVERASGNKFLWEKDAPEGGQLRGRYISEGGRLLREDRILRG